MTLTKRLTGKSGVRYDFVFHSVGKELEGGPGIFAVFTWQEMGARADQADPTRIGPSNDLATDLGGTFKRGTVFPIWRALAGPSVYFLRAGSLAERDAVLLDLWGTSTAPR